MTMITIQGYIQPYKNKLINIQELLLLYNFAVLSVLLIFNGNETMNMITVNVMIGLSFIQFLIILVYHVFSFMITTHCTKLTKSVKCAWNYMLEKCYNSKQTVNHNKNYTMEIPEIQYNFANFQEALLGED